MQHSGLLSNSEMYLINHVNWIELTLRAYIYVHFYSSNNTSVTILALCNRYTSYLQLRAAHPPELAVHRVDFFNQGDQDGVTDPLQNT